MFNNSGHCAHVWPIIGSKGNGYNTGCQTLGLAVATMCRFAFFVYNRWWIIHRFATETEYSRSIFKGLIWPDRTEIRMFSGSLIGKTSCDTWNPKNATDYHIGAKCCHGVAEWLDYAGFGFSLHRRQPEGLLRNMQWRHSRPVAATNCQSAVKPLSDADLGFTLQANRITNNKNSICNEWICDYLERRVWRNGR